MPFGRKSPLEALALPGVILAYKYSQFRQRRREAASRRVTERELSALHHKIDKLLSKLEESEPEPPTSQEDECVICINARATMQTSPCGHRVVCRRCFVKTIQSAVAQRLLPLRCVICRARVNRLTSSSGSWRIQESASSYSVGAKSWLSAGVPQSASSYSVGDNGSSSHNHHNHYNGHNCSGHNRVSQSASLYSMSSGSSSLSNTSNLTSCSNTSSVSSGAESSSDGSSSTNEYNPHRLLSNNSSTSSSSNRSHHQHHHYHHQQQQHHSTCGNGCLGAIPRKPSISSTPPVYIQMTNLNGGPSTHTYPGRRYTKSRIADLQNRLPPIKEYKSPAKVPHPSPVHITNPRLRFASYTKEKSPHETVPLLKDPSPTRVSKDSNIAPTITTNSSTLNKQSSKSGGLTAKVGPTAGKAPIKKTNSFSSSSSSSNTNNNSNNSTTSSYNKNTNNSSTSSSKAFPLLSSKFINSCSISNNKNNNNNSNSNHYSHNQHDEKIDNKKNETMEKKKKEDKLRAKAEKEAKKEEKRIAKEEERLAKIQAKAEKKKQKSKEKELLLANDGGCKK